jgi:hypothetical protein
VEAMCTTLGVPPSTGSNPNGRPSSRCAAPPAASMATRIPGAFTGAAAPAASQHRRQWRRRNSVHHQPASCKLPNREQRARMMPISRLTIVRSIRFRSISPTLLGSWLMPWSGTSTALAYSAPCLILSSGATALHPGQGIDL